jgi:hypothetical protein
MTDLPTIVYRCPGPFAGSSGTTYNSLGVHTHDAYDKAISEGWSATMPEAIEAYLTPPEPARVVAVADEGQTFPDEAPPTRDEMLAKAAEIGLAVDKRWSDKTLASKIIDALMAAEAAKTAEPAPEPAPDPEPTP